MLLRESALPPPADPEPMAAHPAPLRMGTPQRLLERRREMRSAFQPIVSLHDSRPVGFEALLRLPPDCGFPGPAEAFDAAKGTPWLVDLEFAALDTHLASLGALPEGRLFLNFSAAAFLDERMGASALRRRVEKAGLFPDQVVLELTELVHLPDPAHFADRLQPLREERFLLAVDDFGAGFTNVRLLVELGPDFVKIDRSLVTGVAQHARRRVFLESMAALGRRINCSVIAEGVETAEDLATLRACGIEFAQGWAIGRPTEEPVLPASSRAPTARAGRVAAPEDPAGAFAALRPGVPGHTRVGEIVRLFEAQPEPGAVALLEGTKAVSLITRSVLFFHLGHRYGYALWGGRPVSEFAAAHEEGHDRLAASAALEEAAELVRRRPAWRRFDPVVLETERGDYHGLLPVDVLLGEMTRLKVEYALQANALTGIPGSALLARAAESRLLGGQSFALGWVDLDNFKAFNDRYGFTRGDEVLLLLAGLLRTHLQRDPQDFLSHPGGDDFAFLADPEDAAARAEAVCLEFARRVPDLYDPADRSAGGITSMDRRGRSRRFGFVTVSVGIVHWRRECLLDFRRLVELAAEVKSAVKRRGGGGVLANTRALVAAPITVPTTPSVGAIPFPLHAME